LVFKKNILIIDTAHLFFNSLGNKKDLFNEYAVTVGLTETYSNKEIINKINNLRHLKIIKNYFFIKDKKDNLKLFSELKKVNKLINFKAFDYFLMRGSFTIYNKFIIQNYLRNDCIKIVFEDKITYLLSDSLYYALEQNEISKLIRNFCLKNKITIQEKSDIRKRKIIKLKNNNLLIILKKIINFINFYLFKTTLKTFKKGLEKILFSYIYSGKFFKDDKLETITQLTSGDVDLLLLTDKLEVACHELLYKDTKVKVDIFKSLIPKICTCSNKKIRKDILLSPLSGFVGCDEIPQEYLELFLKPLQISIRESNAKEVHLREHPRENGNWQFQLNDYLNKNGLSSKIVSSNEPINEVICNYAGVVGFASGMLRDARNCCDQVFVVGFEELSMLRYPNPQLVFGYAEGINWIRIGYKYHKSFFRRQDYIQDQKPDLLDHIRSLKN
tara:strand:+ start:794 stop:2122 length:1329 start_codon:yes stop_codon:yes gene_type:complete